MKAVRLLPLVAVALALALAACGGGGNSSSGSSSTTGGSTEAETNKQVAETGSGEQIFQANCSSCHKLAAAKATFGTYGPDLDQLKPGEEDVKTQVENGGGIMPAFGKSEILTGTEIEEVAQYVSEEAGK